MMSHESAAGTVMIPVSYADLIDRLSILRIKLAQVNGQIVTRIGIQVAQYARLVSELDLDRQVGELIRSLDRVNRILWRLEDRIRTLENAGDFGQSFVCTSRMIRRINDRRASLKSKLDDLCNSTFVDRKIYA